MATEQEFQRTYVYIPDHSSGALCLMGWFFVIEKLKACCSMAETYLEDIKIDRPVTDDSFDTADLQSRMSMYR